MADEKVLAISSVQGRDQKGVVAQFATFVAERGINIEDMEQRVVHGVDDGAGGEKEQRRRDEPRPGQASRREGVTGFGPITVLAGAGK